MRSPLPQFSRTEVFAFPDSKLTSFLTSFLSFYLLSRTGLRLRV